MFVLTMEKTFVCEWRHFLASSGEPCNNVGEFCILDTSDTSDPVYPEGFHWAHACIEHGAQMLIIASEDNSVPKPEVNRPPWVQPPSVIPPGPGF